MLAVNETVNFLREHPEIHEKYFGRPVVYLRKFKKIADLFKHLKDNIRQNIGSYDAYSFYKKELSHICGWDASRKNYNRALYDKTIFEIIDLLEI